MSVSSPEAGTGQGRSPELRRPGIAAVVTQPAGYVYRIVLSLTRLIGLRMSKIGSFYFSYSCTPCDCKKD